jgi:hypothetical protein
MKEEGRDRKRQDRDRHIKEQQGGEVKEKDFY